jgi:hypothetical protein
VKVGAPGGPLVQGCILVLALSASAWQVRDYRPVTGIGVLEGGRDTVIVLRRFVRDTETVYLTVNPASLSTALVKAGAVAFTEVSWREVCARFAATPYARALKRAEAADDSLQNAGKLQNAGIFQNAGLRRFPETQQGIDLTVDLCPSRKPLDRGLFTMLVKEIGCVEKPVPVAIAVSGRWLRSHGQDFDWLQALADSGDLSLLWINHSYHHYSSDSLPLKMNFLLEKGTDLDAEVLSTEVALLRRGAVPSVFFRFPGLVSEKTVFTKVTGFGLIPVGSDAWLSKGQRPCNGSIVLVHANGNDPGGVRAFAVLLARERTEIAARRWRLFDLRESIRQTEE